MKKRILTVACVALVSASMQAAAVAPPAVAMVPHTDFLAVQFNTVADANLSTHTDSRFRAALEGACEFPVVGPRHAVAPLVAAFGSILVDWFFSRVLEKIDKNLQERIAQYTASYSNDPVYTDVMADGRWSLSGERRSCVVAQRIECEIEKEKADEPNARCADGRLALSVALLLRNTGSVIQVVPVAIHLSELKPQHATLAGDDKASIAVGFSIQAIGLDDRKGFRWDSGELGLIAEECAATPSTKTDPGKADCFEKYPVPGKDATDAEWLAADAQSMPMVPTFNVGGPAARSHAAIKISVAEVGLPRAGLKGFAEFISKNKDDLSGAFSAAVKKKLRFSKE